VTAQCAPGVLEMARPSEPAVIAFVIFGLRFGGAEVALLELVKGLDRSRFTPVIISLEPRGALSGSFEAAGIKLYHIGMTGIEQAPLVLFRTWRLVRRLRPAILHGVMFYGDLVARLLRMVGEKPRVVTAIHTTSIGSRTYEQVMHWSDRYTDAVTAVSNVVARAQVENGSVQSSKVTVIYNGIDLNRLAPPSELELEAQRASLGISESDRVVLCVGRLERPKEHALLLRAFSVISRKIDNLILLIVGRGQLERELRTLATNLHIAHRVRFAGQVSPVAPMFYLAEAFALSSSREGLPLVVLEAMAAGLPMVLTSVGGIPEVVEHEKSGILVAPRDERALANGLERVLTMSPTERVSLVACARQRVQERFRVEQMVSATQDLYDRLLVSERLTRPRAMQRRRYRSVPAASGREG
jgi:glycosyltransferase involved in cell wall biosynthesis